MTGPAQRPLLFVDVDGPVLPFRAPSTPPDHADSRLARIRPEVGDRLAALPCTLVWATTWQEQANAHVAPYLGLPALPVVVWSDPSATDEAEDRRLGLFWKTRTVVAWAAGRPFAWVDDEITDADRHWVAAHHPGPALLHRVDGRTGLVDDDFDALRAWLRRVA